MPKRVISAPQGNGMATAGAGPPPLPRRAGTPTGSPAGSPMASPLPVVRVGGLLSAGNGAARTNSGGKRGGMAPNVPSFNAPITVPVGEVDYQALWDSQSHLESARPGAPPPPVPRHQVRTQSVNYAKLDHSGRVVGRQPSSPPSRQVTSYAQINRVISCEDGTEIPITVVGNGQDTSSDEEFDYDVPPSITHLQQRKSEDHRSPPLSPEDIYDVPPRASSREASLFDADPTYDSPPSVLSELQSQSSAPPLPAKGHRPPPAPPARPLYDHVNPANLRPEEELYDHPPVSNQNELYSHPFFRPPGPSVEEEPDYDPVTPDEPPPPRVPGRPISQVGLPRFPTSRNPVMSANRSSSMMAGLQEGQRPRCSSSSSVGRSQREFSIQYLMHQGYSRDQVVRALAISQNDFKMAERILQEFGN